MEEYMGNNSEESSDSSSTLSGERVQAYQQRAALRRRRRMAALREAARLASVEEKRTAEWPCIDPNLDKVAIKHQKLLDAARDALANATQTTEALLEQHADRQSPLDLRTRSLVAAARRELLRRRFAGEQSQAQPLSSGEEGPVAVELQAEVERLLTEVRAANACSLDGAGLSSDDGGVAAFPESDADHMLTVARADARRWVEALLREHALEIPRAGRRQRITALYKVLLKRFTRTRLRSIQRIHRAVQQSEQGQPRTREPASLDTPGSSSYVPHRRRMSSTEQRRRRETMARRNAAQSGATTAGTMGDNCGQKMAADKVLTTPSTVLPEGLPSADRFAAQGSDHSSSESGTPVADIPPYLLGMKLPERRSIFEVGVATTRLLLASRGVVSILWVRRRSHTRAWLGSTTGLGTAR